MYLCVSCYTSLICLLRLLVLSSFSRSPPFFLPLFYFFFTHHSIGDDYQVDEDAYPPPVDVESKLRLGDTQRTEHRNPASRPNAASVPTCIPIESKPGVVGENTITNLCWRWQVALSSQSQEWLGKRTSSQSFAGAGKWLYRVKARSGWGGGHHHKALLAMVIGEELYYDRAIAQDWSFSCVDFSWSLVVFLSCLLTCWRLLLVYHISFALLCSLVPSLALYCSLLLS